MDLDLGVPGSSKLGSCLVLAPRLTASSQSAREQQDERQEEGGARRDFIRK